MGPLSIKYHAMNPEPTHYSLLETLPEAMLIINPYEDSIEYANQGALTLFKAETEEIKQKRVSQLFYHSLPELINFSESILLHSKGITDDLIGMTSKGEAIELEVSASLYEQAPSLLVLCLRDKRYFQHWRLLNDSDKNQRYNLQNWQGIQNVFQDIEKQNALILSAAGEGIYGVDCEGKATFVNPAAEGMLGWKADELIGVNIHSVIHHSHTDGSDFCVNDCPIYCAFNEGEVRTVDDDAFWTKSGKAIPVEYTSTPIIENKQIVGAVVIFRDVSEKKLSQEKLRNALEEVEHLKGRLELENAYLQEEISENYNRHEIIGKSPACEQVINQIQVVAPTYATVLINGESGTGKELIARAIHNASERKDRPLVRVNCAAIPRDLFESEFFGHAKGSFSGALSERRGRFEVANGGTLFLDEVGELPLELQGKLLRVLQDNEFERVGESITRTVDVRVIAATNRDLEQDVKEGKFREDLFFRLNVFPIRSAPLRERSEDIPMLVSYFLKKVCNNLNKNMLTISVGQMQRLQEYNWPGNIRELENVIERQVILSRGDRLEFNEIPQYTQVTPTATQTTPATVITEAECVDFQKRAIIDALKRTKGKIYGEDGAAQLLGLKPTTLTSRIKKMQIQRKQV